MIGRFPVSGKQQTAESAYLAVGWLGKAGALKEKGLKKFLYENAAISTHRKSRRKNNLRTGKKKPAGGHLKWLPAGFSGLLSSSKVFLPVFPPSRS